MPMDLSDSAETNLGSTSPEEESPDGSARRNVHLTE